MFQPKSNSMTVPTIQPARNDGKSVDKFVRSHSFHFTGWAANRFKLAALADCFLFEIAGCNIDIDRRRQVRAVQRGRRPNRMAALPSAPQPLPHQDRNLCHRRRVRFIDVNRHMTYCSYPATVASSTYFNFATELLNVGRCVLANSACHATAEAGMVASNSSADTLFKLSFVVGDRPNHRTEAALGSVSRLLVWAGLQRLLPADQPWHFSLELSAAVVGCCAVVSVDTPASAQPLASRFFSRLRPANTACQQNGSLPEYKIVTRFILLSHFCFDIFLFKILHCNRSFGKPGFFC